MAVYLSEAMAIRGRHDVFPWRRMRNTLACANIVGILFCPNGRQRVH